MARINPQRDRIYYSHYSINEQMLSWNEGKDGHATIAMMFDDFAVDDEGNEHPTKVSWAVSWCSPNDKFIKLNGRQLASERVLDEKNRTSVINFIPWHSRTFSYYDLGRLLISFEQVRHNVPSWARGKDVF